MCSECTRVRDARASVHWCWWNWMEGEARELKMGRASVAGGDWSGSG